MGEIADMMLDGTLCAGCGELLEAGDGFPRRCAACEHDAELSDIDQGSLQIAAQTHKTCRKCGKRVKWDGLNDHMRAKHSAP